MIEPTPMQNPGQPQPQQGGEGAPDKDKDIYDMIVANAQGFIHDDKNADRITTAMSQGDPAEVAGSQAAIVLNGIVESAGRNGITPTADVAIAAAAATISEIIDLAVAAGVIEEVPLEDRDFQKKAMDSFKKTLGVPETQESPEAEAVEPEQESPMMEEAEAQPGAGVLGRAQGGM